MSTEGDDVSVDEKEGGVPSSSKSNVHTVESVELGDARATKDNTSEKHSSEDVTTEPLKISKTQLKKLRKKAEWEEGREDRKVKRRGKLKAKKERQRAAKQEEEEQQVTVGGKLELSREVKKEAQAPDSVHNSDLKNGDENGKAHSKAQEPAKESRNPPTATQLPITIVFDCQFDDLMKEGELVSLASQLTRCYSDNKKALFRAHLVISSFGGRLKDRFEGLLARHHESWKGVRFLEEDWVATAEKAKGWMREEKGGTVAGALRNHLEAQPQHEVKSSEDLATSGEVVYLSSDSPNTLTELRPFSTYIIGGLVDRNRHKGICYKKAVERNIRTAKLPIGQFIDMQTRAVLATNHVNDIMLKWLEIDDWGKAFYEVIPKRKGGKLKEKDDDAEATPETSDGREHNHSIREEHSDDIEEQPEQSDGIMTEPDLEPASDPKDVESSADQKLDIDGPSHGADNEGLKRKFEDAEEKEDEAKAKRVRRRPSAEDHFSS